MDSHIQNLKYFDSSPYISLATSQDSCGEILSHTFLSDDPTLSTSDISGFIPNCPQNTNTLSIYNFSQKPLGSFFEYTVSYCCEIKPTSLFEHCTAYWKYDCSTGTLTGPEFGCFSTNATSTFASDIIFYLNVWLNSAEPFVYYYHTSVDNCPCSSDASYSVSDPTIPENLCDPVVSPTETALLTTKELVENQGGYYIDQVTCGDDEPADFQCSLSAVSEVLNSFNEDDSSYRVFYHQTSRDLFYEHQNCGIATKPSYGTGDDLEVSGYSSNFNIKNAGKLSFNHLLSPGFHFVFTFPDYALGYISILSPSGSAAVPRLNPSLNYTIKDYSLLSKTFSFGSYEDFGEQNICQLNSYWLYDLPTFIYKDDVNLSNLPEFSLPKLHLYNNYLNLSVAHYYFSGSGSSSVQSDKEVYIPNYSNVSDVFIKNQTLPFNFNFNQLKTINDPIYNTDQLSAGAIFSIELEFSFSPDYSLVKPDLLSELNNSTISRREKFSIFGSPYIGRSNIERNYSYPDNYGKDLTFNPKSHGLKFVKGQALRIY
jgi:hypothetical protein